MNFPGKGVLDELEAGRYGIMRHPGLGWKEGESTEKDDGKGWHFWLL